jgi:hypothetical protein
MGIGYQYRHARHERDGEAEAVSQPKSCSLGLTLEAPAPGAGTRREPRCLFPLLSPLHHVLHPVLHLLQRVSRASHDESSACSAPLMATVHGKRGGLAVPKREFGRDIFSPVPLASLLLTRDDEGKCSHFHKTSRGPHRAK